ncbi:MAG: GSU2403 family nucleotidyltransferase fold protein [Hyphomicrobiales bacterium]
MPAWPISYQNIAADLVAGVYNDAGQMAGSVYTQAQGSVSKVYVKRAIGDTRQSVYLGRADDPATDQKITAIKAASQRAKQRRKDLRVLAGQGLLATPTLSGQVIDTIAQHGLFQRGAILIGTLAYQCYPLLLGATLPSTMMATDDADLAAANLSLDAADGSDMETILRFADKSFAGVPGLSSKNPPWKFMAANKYLVELLTPARGRNDPQPLELAGLKAGATTLQHLAWLIDNSVPACLPYATGVAVQVPRPERYAVHKLIISQKRDDRIKARKDLLQAEALVAALEERLPGTLGDELEDAAAQGAGWRKPMMASIKAIWPDWKDRPEFEVLLD